MIPRTIKELKKYMIDNCYNCDLYAVIDKQKHDGFGLEEWGELYVWYYVERGNRENINYFNAEEKAVEYIYDVLLTDKFARSHFFKLIDDPLKKNELVNSLNNKKIEFWTDEIPYLGIDGKATRFFIVGCDIKKVKDFN
ncbi:hypothetical protein [Flavobacterium sp.]|uniref:hypothetical protein n=1 Tax=Flavobacterium sp. TaxID=239 RepID=UPI00375263A1